MVGRKYKPAGYRYGFGGHERDDEVKGDGNHLAFGDYGYDTRLGRRWNIDPVINTTRSNYGAFGNNPILNIDHDGNIDFPYFSSSYPQGLSDYFFRKMITEPVDNLCQAAGNLMGTVKVKVGVSAGVGLEFKATKYVQGKIGAELAGADLTLNTGQASVRALKAEGRVTVGSKGGLDINGSLSAIDFDFSDAQNVMKLETPNLDKFTFASVESKAQFTKLFEVSGSAWAVQNKKGEWSFLDGSYDIGVKQDVFDKTDVHLGLKLGVKVQIGVDLKGLYNLLTTGKEGE